MDGPVPDLLYRGYSAGSMKVSLVIVSKDEPALADTLDAVEKLTSGLLDEVVVVDASQRRLDRVRIDHPWVAWHDYEQPEGVRVTISHQRNIGVARARGDVIVFIDCGCIPRAHWLDRLLAPDLRRRRVGHVRSGRIAGSEHLFGTQLVGLHHRALRPRSSDN